MKPQASLSLDLDNQWSYMKIHGDAGWEQLPSYLDLVVPHILRFLHERALTITIFVVGLDAAQPRNHTCLRALASCGHEIGNHSFYHEPWVVRAAHAQVYEELARAHDAIARVTGREPSGFRGPGFATSQPLLDSLTKLNYRYDASSLPTFIGPLARWYYFRSAKLSRSERAERSRLFGSWLDVLHQNRAHERQTAHGPILEIPVTTMPGARIPIHFSYLHYLDRYSPQFANHYFHTALQLCARSGTAPSLLLHPLDFLGGDDVPELRFFPGMDIAGDAKRASTSRFVDILLAHFSVVTLSRHVCA
jgi:peptidoglycan/xylan/chitin deacetylase (PgdA/CDA1 family)